jgi:hypothetical protein
MGIDSVIAGLREWAVGAWVWWRTYGLAPTHPDHGKYALLRARLRGGVRV